MRMSDVEKRIERAFRDEAGFVPVEDEPGVYEATTAAFDTRVAAAGRTDGRAAFDVTVIAPTLSAATAGEVADVVETGWFETFELRVGDVGGVLRGDRDLAPAARRTDDRVIVESTFADLDPRRGVADALALINFVEGTYVQGVVPGYEYEGAVAELVTSARRTGGSDGVER
jgi:hypothetical protein